MTRISFYGYSDDVAYMVDEETGSYKDVGAFDRPAIGEIVAPNGERVRVVGIYAPGNNAGCWSFGIQQYDEGEPIPSWAINVVFERDEDVDYSVRMYLDVPDGYSFKWLGGEE